MFACYADDFTLVVVHAVVIHGKAQGRNCMQNYVKYRDLDQGDWQFGMHGLAVKRMVPELGSVLSVIARNMV